ncbi:MAG: hypothetical protein N2572_08110 [Syntrophales bacterium]|nr:hypothetical protein [Syntrophales bacterium]
MAICFAISQVAKRPEATFLRYRCSKRFICEALRPLKEPKMGRMAAS